MSSLIIIYQQWFWTLLQWWLTCKDQIQTDPTCWMLPAGTTHDFPDLHDGIPGLHGNQLLSTWFQQRLRVLRDHPGVEVEAWNQSAHLKVQWNLFHSFKLHTILTFNWWNIWVIWYLYLYTSSAIQNWGTSSWEDQYDHIWHHSIIRSYAKLS